MISGDALTPENAWRRIGFYRHAQEYWLLASVIIDRLTSPDPAWRNESPSDSDQAQQPNLREATPPDPILSRYDQTSMRQVNDLIADFQKFQIISEED